ncbi:hypothetical protein QQ045_024854 [Rhodiola kirilowii]
MDGGSTPISTAGLMCYEGEGCLLERSNGVDEILNFGAEIDEEYVEMLIEREAGDDVGFKGLGFDSDPSDGCLEKSSNWIRDARLDAVKWMLNVRALFGFQFSTVYLAMTYFDQFISQQSIDNGKYWAVRLLSVSCLSVAAKMEEEQKVPALSDYPLGDFMFDKCVIQKMEVLVLSILEWKMASVTPFAYFSYFIDKFCGDSVSSKLKDQYMIKATQCVMDMMQEMNLMSRRPSSLAAAAILAALDLQLNEKALGVKLEVIRSSRSLNNEEILSLFSFLHETEKKKCKTPVVDILSNPSSSRGCSLAVDDKSVSATSIIGTKRLLSYNSNDKDHESSSKKTHQ